MIILKPIGTAQDLKFISRVDTADSVVIRDEQNNTEVTISGTFSLSTYYLTASLIFSLTEGKFYNLTVYKTLVSDYITRVEDDGGTVESQSCFAEFNTEDREVVYRDKIFCTAQTISDYTINDGEYTQHSSTNEFITL